MKNLWKFQGFPIERDSFYLRDPRMEYIILNSHVGYVQVDVCQMCYL